MEAYFIYLLVAPAYEGPFPPSLTVIASADNIGVHPNSNVQHAAAAVKRGDERKIHMNILERAGVNIQVDTLP